MTEKVAPHSMEAMYQVDELVRCEGDVFDNFKKFHMAMFSADAMQPIFRNTQTAADDYFTTTVAESKIRSKLARSARLQRCRAVARLIAL
jgi:hypothetical protein